MTKGVILVSFSRDLGSFQPSTLPSYSLPEGMNFGWPGRAKATGFGQNLQQRDVADNLHAATSLLPEGLDRNGRTFSPGFQGPADPRIGSVRFHDDHYRLDDRF